MISAQAMSSRGAGQSANVGVDASLSMVDF
jgi:hypothetical protein